MNRVLNDQSFVTIGLILNYLCVDNCLRLACCSRLLTGWLLDDERFWSMLATRLLGGTGDCAQQFHPREHGEEEKAWRRLFKLAWVCPSVTVLCQLKVGHTPSASGWEQAKELTRENVDEIEASGMVPVFQSQAMHAHPLSQVGEECRSLLSHLATFFRLKGNGLFAVKQYEPAVSCYTRGIRMMANTNDGAQVPIPVLFDTAREQRRTGVETRDPSGLAQLYGNRSVARLRLKQFDLAASDALHAWQLAPWFDKAIFRLCSAIVARHDVDNASPLAALFRCALDVALDQRAAVGRRKPFARTFQGHALTQLDPETVTSPVPRAPAAVTWVNAAHGHGVVAEEPFQPGSLVLVEPEPLVCAQKVTDTRTCCFECLRGRLDPDDVPSKAVFDTIVAASPRDTTWVTGCDDGCEFHYCSLKCQEKGSPVHSVLCPCPEYQTFLGLCRASNRTTPLLVLKMFLRIVMAPSPRVTDDSSSSWIPGPADCLELSQEWQRTFASFVYRYVTGPQDQQFIHCIHQILDRSSPVLRHGWKQFCVLDRFQRLVGVLSMNSQDIQPLSDVQACVNDADDASLDGVFQAAYGRAAVESLSLERVRALCVQGTGLFALINKLNHSCAPNCASVSLSRSSAAGLVCLLPIESGGPELFISYVNEDLPFKERQRQLKQMYDFECDCVKCKLKK